MSRYFAFLNTKAKTGRSAGDSPAKRKWEIYTASVFYILPLKSFCIDLSTLICTIKPKWLIEAMLLISSLGLTCVKGKKKKSCQFRLKYECKTLMEPFNCKMGSGLCIHLTAEADHMKISDVSDE